MLNWRAMALALALPATAQVLPPSALTFPETNALSLHWRPPASSNVVGYAVYVAAGRNAGTFACSNWTGSTNIELGLTNALPWWIYASAFDGTNFSELSAPLYWDGWMLADVTNRVTIVNPSTNNAVLVSPDLLHWTPTNFSSLTLVNPTGNCFFRGFGLTISNVFTGVQTNAP